MFERATSSPELRPRLVSLALSGSLAAGSANIPFDSVLAAASKSVALAPPAEAHAAWASPDGSQAHEAEVAFERSLESADNSNEPFYIAGIGRRR